MTICECDGSKSILALSPTQQPGVPIPYWEHIQAAKLKFAIKGSGRSSYADTSMLPSLRFAMNFMYSALVSLKSSSASAS